jgi:hypothetical protein
MQIEKDKVEPARLPDAGDVARPFTVGDIGLASQAARPVQAARHDSISQNLLLKGT